jgi:hypothetical protein
MTSGPPPRTRSSTPSACAKVLHAEAASRASRYPNLMGKCLRGQDDAPAQAGVAPLSRLEWGATVMARSAAIQCR